MKNESEYLLGRVEVGKETKAISIGEVGGRQYVRVGYYFIATGKIITKDHASCTSMSCFCTFVNSTIVSP